MQRLIIASDQVAGTDLVLTPDQQHYLYRVLRLAAGDRFLALDGQGQQWLAELTSQTGRAIATAQPTLDPLQPNITLAIAIPKGSGFDDVVRQTTEIGVATLQPVISDRTLHQPNPKKLDRWRRIAAEATEQSERPRLPTLHDPLPWNRFLRQPLPPQRWICVARGDALPLLTVAQGGDPTVPVVLATGPEGGWTAAELEAALAQGFQPVSLGPTILRAVTAPLVALTLALAGLANDS